MARYRTGLLVFSAGLIWGVSQLASQEDDASVIDSATDSIVHKLHERQDANPSPAQHRVPVSQSAWTNEASNQIATGALSGKGEEAADHNNPWARDSDAPPSESSVVNQNPPAIQASAIHG